MCESSTCEKCRCCNCSDTTANLHRLTPVCSACPAAAYHCSVGRGKPDGFGVHVQAALTVLAYLDTCDKKTEANSSFSSDILAKFPVFRRACLLNSKFKSKRNLNPLLFFCSNLPAKVEFLPNDVCPLMLHPVIAMVV